MKATETHDNAVGHGLRRTPVEHSGRVKLAYVLIRVGARVRLSDDDVLDVEWRWKTGRVYGRSTVSSHTHTQTHIISPVLEGLCYHILLCVLRVTTL